MEESKPEESAEKAEVKPEAEQQKTEEEAKPAEVNMNNE